MLNRAIFRWGNRGRRFKRGARELKGAHKKLDAHGASRRRSSWTARILDAEPGNATATSAARRASLTGGSERAPQGKGAGRRSTRRISRMSLRLSSGEGGAAAEAEAEAAAEAVARRRRRRGPWRDRPLRRRRRSPTRLRRCFKPCRPSQAALTRSCSPTRFATSNARPRPAPVASKPPAKAAGVPGPRRSGHASCAGRTPRPPCSRIAGQADWGKPPGAASRLLARPWGGLARPWGGEWGLPLPLVGAAAGAP